MSDTNALPAVEPTEEPTASHATRATRTRRKPTVEMITDSQRGTVENTPAVSQPREAGDEPERKPLPVLEIKGWAHNNGAGVQHLTYTNRDPEKKRFETWIKFRDGKPSQEVRQHMKDNGFQWHGDAPEAGQFKGEGAWTHPIGYLTGAQDRLHGERVYREVVDMTLKEKGLEPQPEISQPF